MYSSNISCSHHCDSNNHNNCTQTTQMQQPALQFKQCTEANIILMIHHWRCAIKQCSMEDANNTCHKYLHNIMYKFSKPPHWTIQTTYQHIKYDCTAKQTRYACNKNSTANWPNLVQKFYIPDLVVMFWCYNKASNDNFMTN